MGELKKVFSVFRKTSEGFLSAENLQNGSFQSILLIKTLSESLLLREGLKTPFINLGFFYISYVLQSVINIMETFRGSSMHTRPLNKAFKESSILLF